MKLATSLVAVKKIVSSKPRSLFAENDLEQAAQLILNTEGVVNPIIVRRNGLQSYEIVDGDFEYYAAARAREINPIKGEMIGVFIIEPENEDNLTQQVEVFRKPKENADKVVTFTAQDLEKFLNNLESRIEKLAKELLQESTAKVSLEYQIKELKKQLSEKIEPLAIFKNLDERKIAEKLRKAGFTAKEANQIASVIVDEREKEQFKSLNDVVERLKKPHGKTMRKMIGEKKMLDIIENLYVSD